MGWKTLILIAVLGLFLVGCFPGTSEIPAESPDSNREGSAVDTTAPPLGSTGDTGSGTAKQTPLTENQQPEAQNTMPTSPAPAGSTDSSSSSAAATSGSTSSADTSTVPEPFAPGTRAANSGNGEATDGGSLILLFRDPPTFDPHLAEDNISGLFVNELFGGLVTIEPFNFSVAPDLAESWEVSEDGTVYTFHLRPEAKFHDGKPVTAMDVKWSLERVSDPETVSPVVDQYLNDIVGVKAKLNGAASEVEGVKVIDDHTIQITIDAPKAYFLAKLTYPTGFVLDQANVEGSEDWIRNPNGTGPFRLAEYEIGEVLRLARNEYYHLGPPHLDEVEMILSGGSAMILYENDEVHVTGVGLADLERILDPSSSLNSQVHPYPARFSTSYIGLNATEPPLDDPKFREALNLAVDRDNIAAVVYEGAVRPAKTIIPPRFPGFNPDSNPYPYDPERARQLLAESKYGDSLDDLPRMTLSISGSLGAAVPLGLEVILQAWEQELGIQVDIQQTEWATFLEDVNDERYQMFSLAWAADYPDPENFLDLLFHSESEGNRTNYSNLQVDALLEEARVEQDRSLRLELYQRIEQMILDDAPWVLLWNDEDWYFLIKPNVKDYFLLPLSIPKFRYIHLSEE
jgi:ABC-type transport system substrate-binding protein